MSIHNPRHTPAKLYFAYGSNLNKLQMRADPAAAPDLISNEYCNRCPDSIAIATFELDGYRLAFVGERTGRWGRGGVATVIPAADACVHGALYRISPADEETLNKLEGYNKDDPAAGSYYKDETTAKYDSEPVMLYIATARADGENPPSQRYLDTIRQGYEMWGLPLGVLEAVETYPAEAGN